MTMQDIARFLGVSTTMSKRIDKRSLKTRYSKSKDKHVNALMNDKLYQLRRELQRSASE